MLIGSAVFLVLGLLAVVGVVVTRSTGDGPEPVASPAAPTTTAPPTAVNMNALCERLTPALPPKAHGFVFQPGRFNGLAHQNCQWYRPASQPDSTYSLMVDVNLEHDVDGAVSWYHKVQGMLENKNSYNVTFQALPGVGDQAESGIIPDSNFFVLLPGPNATLSPPASPSLKGFPPPQGIPSLQGIPSAPPFTVVKDYSRPGAAALVQVGAVVIRIEWVGADYPPGTPPGQRDHRANGAGLPQEQARDEAITLAREVIRLLDS